MTEKLRELQARGRLTAVQVQAGVAFEADYRAAVVLLSHRSMKAERRGRADAITCDQLAVQRARYHNACKALGPLKEIVIAVAVEGRSAREWTDDAGEPADAAMPMLRLGLATLVRFYDLRAVA